MIGSPLALPERSMGKITAIALVFIFAAGAEARCDNIARCLVPIAAGDVSSIESTKLAQGIAALPGFGFNRAYLSLRQFEP